MPSILSSIILLAMAQAALSTPMKQFQKRTCYDYGASLKFNELHGGDVDDDLSGEVDADIVSTCQQAAGKIIRASEPFWLCTNWAETTTGDCQAACAQGCGDAGPGTGFAVGLCKAACASKTCDAPDPNAYNRIEWAVEVRDGNPEKELTYDACVAAFRTELGGCREGGEETHDGLWYRIDPNAGACPA